ncbi:MAG: hypothetical protein JNM47_01410 [Hyphomonadaceae bacterium]|nr:hypothetical protein [Hyphomonadaceae bacterium]
MMRILATMLAVVTLGGCAVLTAPAPLFSPADRDGAFALEEGLWAFRDRDCRVDPLRSAPNRKSCLDWARIRRLQDGGWIAEPASPEDAGDAPIRFDVFPASTAEPAARAPLYVAEGRTEKDEGMNYAAIVPRENGDRDSRAGTVRRLALVLIECNVILRDGDRSDIAFQRTDGRVTGCVAQSRDAVREAARRSTIAKLATLGDEELIWVRR